MADTNQSSNQDASSDYSKLDVQQGTSDTTVGDSMQTDSKVGRVSGGTLPTGSEGSGTPRGGINTSDSTVAAGGTAGGGTVGAESTTDRGRIPEHDFTQHSQHMMNRMSGGQMSGQTASTPETAPGDQATVETQNVPQEQGRKGLSPLSPEEAEKINEDAKLASGAPDTPDVGNIPR